MTAILLRELTRLEHDGLDLAGTIAAERGCIVIFLLT